MPSWILGSFALLLSIFLAFRFAGSRRSLYATLAVIIILGAAGAALVFVETRQSSVRDTRSASRISPEDVAISDATLTHEYGRWHLRGGVTNNSEFEVVSLTIRVTVKECASEPCRTVGETQTTNHGMSVAPGAAGLFGALLYLPHTEPPKDMRWDYEVLAVGAGR